MRNPIIAGVLSLLIPGVGQLYNGNIFWGVIWLIVAFLNGFVWIGSAGLLGWIAHVVCAYLAYSYAKDHPVR